MDNKPQLTSKELLERYKQTQTAKKGDDYLYFIQSNNTGRIKIGRAKNPHKRIRELQTGNGEELRLIAYFQGWAWRERHLHELLKRFRLSGEWFSYDCLSSIPDDIYELIEFGAFDDWWKG